MWEVEFDSQQVVIFPVRFFKVWKYRVSLKIMFVVQLSTRHISSIATPFYHKTFNSYQLFRFVIKINVKIDHKLRIYQCVEIDFKLLLR